MFKIYLYRFTGENIEVDKTSKLTLLAELSGTLRNSTSVINPSIMIETNNDEFFVVDDNNIVVMDDNGNGVVSSSTLEDTLLVANYCYIPKFNRYYFITNIYSVKTLLWEIDMSVDVLMSYKSDILKQSALVNRNEFEYNNFILDPNIPSVYDYEYTIYETSVNARQYDRYYNVVDLSIGYAHYVINMLSKAGRVGIDDKRSLNLNTTPYISPFNAIYYLQTFDDFATFCERVISPDFFESVNSLFGDVSEYISNIYIVPFDYDTIIDNNSIYQVEGNKNVRMSMGDYFIYNYSDDDSDDFQRATLIKPSSRMWFWFDLEEDGDLPPFETFLDKEPYSIYHIYLPFYGITKINSDLFTNGYTLIFYDVDITTGDTIIRFAKKIPNGSGGLTIPDGGYAQLTSPVSFTCNCYAKVGVGATNANSQWQSLALGSIKGVIGLIQDIGSAVASATTGMGIEGGTISGALQTVSETSGMSIGSVIENMPKSTGVKSASNFINALVDTVAGMKPRAVTSAEYPNLIKYKNYLHPFIIKSKPKVYIPENYNHLFGRPLFQTRNLSNVHGFTTIANVHLSGFATATDGEKVSITNLLISGIILP